MGHTGTPPFPGHGKPGAGQSCWTNPEQPTGHGVQAAPAVPTPHLGQDGASHPPHLWADRVLSPVTCRLLQRRNSAACGSQHHSGMRIWGQSQMETLPARARLAVLLPQSTARTGWKPRLAGEAEACLGDPIRKSAPHPLALTSPTEGVMRVSDPRAGCAAPARSTVCALQPEQTPRQ